MKKWLVKTGVATALATVLLFIATPVLASTVYTNYGVAGMGSSYVNFKNSGSSYAGLGLTFDSSFTSPVTQLFIEVRNTGSQIKYLKTGLATQCRKLVPTISDEDNRVLEFDFDSQDLYGVGEFFISVYSDSTCSTNDTTDNTRLMGLTGTNLITTRSLAASDLLFDPAIIIGNDVAYVSPPDDSTFVPPVDCGSFEFLCKLIIPRTSVMLSVVNDFQSKLATKIPFGYFYAVKDSIANIDNSNSAIAPTFQIHSVAGAFNVNVPLDISGSAPVQQLHSTTAPIFIGALWLGFLFWIVMKVIGMGKGKE